MGRGDTLINAVIGAVVGLVVGFVPVINLVSPFVGGGAAGYLQQETYKDAAITGALSGVLLAVVFGGITFLLVSVVGLSFIAGGVPGFGAAFGGSLTGILLVAIVFLAIVSAVLTGIGGLIGHAVRTEM